MSAIKSFKELGLASVFLQTLDQLGYETPTPIQAQSIPLLMAGDDLLAQAQTGTGKTAAFALPVLSQINVSTNQPQALVIAPTRELAIQVAEAFQSYAKGLKGFHVAPIYGGQDYRTQLRALKRGAHVIVGTPGRVMDHLRRGSLRTDSLKTVVLDEADEMLKMGFIDDVEWILEQIPQTHQTALFSATMPTSIQNIANRYLTDARKIQIKAKKNNVETIAQFYTCVANKHKLDMLTRYLEVESIQAAIIFARTKNSSNELAEKLQARGYAASALNGDMNQSLREKTLGRLKNRDLDIIVATDVAARGIDVDRISHVINYDIPYDTESYIHRIGRTGRAGRSGKALLLVTPRERRLLRDIEKAVGQSIAELEPPTREQMNVSRSKKLAEKVAAVLSNGHQLKPFYEMVESIVEQTGYDEDDIAVALAYLSQENDPLPSFDITPPVHEKRQRRDDRRGRDRDANRPRRRQRSSRSDDESKPSRKKPVNAKSKAKSKTKTKSKSKADTKKVKTKSKTTKTKLKLKSKAKSKPKTKAKSKTKPKSKQKRRAA